MCALRLVQESPGDDALTQTGHGEAVTWEPTKPRLRPLRLLVSWAIAAATLYVAAIIVPGVTLEEPGAAFVVAAVVAVLNAFVPPVIAALRLPFMLALGFIIVLLVDALAAAARRRAAAGLHQRRTPSGTRCSPRS